MIDIKALSVGIKMMQQKLMSIAKEFCLYFLDCSYVCACAVAGGMNWRPNELSSSVGDHDGTMIYRICGGSV